MPDSKDWQALYEALKLERPKFHSAHDGATATETAAYNWSLNHKVLDWLNVNLKSGYRTIETGCGYSTVMLAVSGCHHNVVSSFPEEHQCINDWCLAHGVSNDFVSFHVGRSERVLPNLDPVPLDQVLIDGDHAVQLPLIDYFYLADWIVKYGLLLVNDVQLPSVRQLSDFLDTERPRWTFVKQINRTRIYRKLVDGKVTGLLWREQPFSEVATRRKPSIIVRGLRKIRRMITAR